MSVVFEPGRINGMELANRLVRSATWEGMCEPDGRPTDRLVTYLTDLARGGIGLIISGYSYVRPEGKQSPGKMGMHTDGLADDVKRLTEAVHEASGKICVQLVHCGGEGDRAQGGRNPVAPSAVDVAQYPEVPDELTKQEVVDIVEAFGDAARRAKAWGFDAVQLHGAHGYLINQFLSPLTNRRTDEYGGDLEGRCRFLMSAYTSVRAAVGPDFPVMIKLNSCDHLEGGLAFADALFAARLLQAGGIDAIEVSGGTPASGAESPARTRIRTAEDEGYFLENATRIKQAVACPVIAVGGFRSIEVIEEAIASGAADYVALSRPLIREPDLPNRWKSGDRTRAHCISCNGCFKPAHTEGGVYCVPKRKMENR